MTRPSAAPGSRALLVLAASWTGALAVTSALLTVLAVAGQPDVLVAAGLLGVPPVASGVLAVTSWVLSAVVGAVCAVLATPGALRFVPPVAGTIALAVPMAIAAVLPGALWQWSNAAASVPTAVPAGLTVVVATSLVIAAVVASSALVLADRRRRSKGAGLATNRGVDSRQPAPVVTDRGADARQPVGPGIAPTPRPFGTTAPPADGRPTHTVVTGGRPEVPDSALVHALKNVVTSIDETECGWVVDGIVDHLRLHTAQHFPTRPIGYQFQLSNGALVTVSDQAFGKRRALDFTADKVVEGWSQPLTMLIWPKDLPDHGGWFSWPMDGKAGERMRRDIANAVRLTYSNRSWRRVESFVLLDPLAPPAPLSPSDWPDGAPNSGG